MSQLHRRISIVPVIRQLSQLPLTQEIALYINGTPADNVQSAPHPRIVAVVQSPIPHSQALAQHIVHTHLLMQCGHEPD